MKLLVLAVGSILLGTVCGIGATVVHFEWTTGSDRPVAVSVSEGDPTENPTPKIVVDNQNFDFGSMERGSKMSHAFVVTNTGSLPLTIKVEKTSCKCTLGSIEKNSIPPGESGKVTLEWKAESLQRLFRHGATLKTNDPARELVNLTVEGKVIQSVTLEPPALIFGKAMVDQTTRGEVRLLAYNHDDIELLKFEAFRKPTASFFDVTSERLTSEELEGTEAKSGLRIKVSIKPGMTIGRFDQWLELTTNVSGGTRLPLQVRGLASGPISVSGNGWSPERGILVLGGVKSSEGLKRELRITVRGEHRHDFRFLRSGFKGKGLTYQLSGKKPLGAVDQYILYLEIPKGAPAVNHLGGQPSSKLAEILLETNHPLAKRLKIPVSFAIEQ